MRRRDMRGGNPLAGIQREATERKLAEAVRVIRVRAEQGEADAQYSLGDRYRQSQGVPRDYAEAVRWLRKAADQGYAKAQSGLAFMYYRRPRSAAGRRRGCPLVPQSRRPGLRDGSIRLAFSYAHGQGVPKDDAEAFRWYREAADQGYAKAQYVLGWMYYHGQGVPQDYAEAFRWFRKAADQGDKAAQAI